MSALSSSSTLAEVQAAYDNNASYAEDGSATKAAAFVTACRILLRRQPSMITHANRQMMMLDLKRISEELKAAQRYAANASAGAVIHSSFETFRD